VASKRARTEAHQAVDRQVVSKDDCARGEGEAIARKQRRLDQQIRAGAADGERPSRANRLAGGIQAVADKGTAGNKYVTSGKAPDASERIIWELLQIVENGGHVTAVFYDLQ
jgi:hypothetical protein